MTLLFHAVLIRFFYLTTDKSTLLEKKSFFSRRQETFFRIGSTIYEIPQIFFLIIWKKSYTSKTNHLDSTSASQQDAMTTVPPTMITKECPFLLVRLRLMSC